MKQSSGLCSKMKEQISLNVNLGPSQNYLHSYSMAVDIVKISSFLLLCLCKKGPVIIFSTVQYLLPQQCGKGTGTPKKLTVSNIHCALQEGLSDFFNSNSSIGTVYMKIALKTTVPVHVDYLQFIHLKEEDRTCGEAKATSYLLNPVLPG